MISGLFDKFRIVSGIFVHIDIEVVPQITYNIALFTLEKCSTLRSSGLKMKYSDIVLSKVSRSPFYMRYFFI